MAKLKGVLWGCLACLPLIVGVEYAIYHGESLLRPVLCVWRTVPALPFKLEARPEGRTRSEYGRAHDCSSSSSVAEQGLLISF